MRHFRRHWQFQTLVSLILAVGVSATTVMFSVIDAFLFRGPAHVRDPHSLMSVTAVRTYSDFVAVRSRSQTLDLAAYRRNQIRLESDRTSVEATAECVTTDYFKVLGVMATLGRTFTGETAPVAVLSHASWAEHLGSTEALPVTSVRVNGYPFTVQGVAPSGFAGILAEPPAIWIPLTAAPEACTGDRGLLEANVTVVGRLRPHVTTDAAEAELSTIAAAIAGQNRSQQGPSLLQAIQQARLPGIRRDLRVSQWAFAAAGFLLVIACANVSGLLSLAVARRRRELALRKYFGASRWRLIRQLLVEQIPVAWFAGVLSVGLSITVLWSLDRAVPMVFWQAPLEPRTVVFLAAAIALASGLGVIGPAIGVTGGNVLASLRDQEPTATRQTRTATLLLLVQVALSFSLVVGAGLMIRSVRNLWTDTGYAVENLVSVSIDARSIKYRSTDETAHLFEVLLERAARVPAVQQATLTSGTLLGSLRDRVAVPVLRRPDSLSGAGVVTGARVIPGHAGIADLHAVAPGYFDAVGTRVLRGRGFAASDDKAAARVIVIDETLATALWPGEKAVGQCAYFLKRPECVEVIGVTETRRHSHLAETTPEVFIPLAQGSSYGFSYSTVRSLLLRVGGSARTAVADVEGALRATVPDVPLSVRALEDLADVQVRSWRLGARLFGLFGAGGVLMGAVGLYTALAFSVRGRVREIGLRMALGASRGRILAAVCMQTFWTVAGGIAIGAGIIALTARLTAWLLFNVAAVDPATLTIAAVVLFGAAMLGAVRPAFHAATIDASVALRDE